MNQPAIRERIRAAACTGPWTSHHGQDRADTFTYGPHRLTVQYSGDGSIGRASLDSAWLDAGSIRPVILALLARDPGDLAPPYGHYRREPGGAPACPACLRPLLAAWCPYCHWHNGVDRPPWQGGA
jgi:hypothetical protein